MTLAKTNVDSESQVRSMITYNDQLASGSGLESGASSLNDDMSSVFSQLNRIINSTVAGNDWYNGLVVPSTPDTGTARGVNDLNTDLNTLERKRILKRVSRVGTDVGVSSAATGTLTSTGTNVSNSDTVVIDAKTYTFQTTLTDVDGNVQIGVDAATSLSNLAGAINLTGTPGTDYASSMTLHPTVYASSITSTTLVGTAKTQGSAGNSIASTDTAAELSWGGATLSGGGATTAVIVLAPTQLPGNTTAAIGAVVTLGVVAATATTFGTAGLDEVAGSNNIQPKNLWVLVDASTGEPLSRTGGVADAKQVYGLVQTQSSTNGSTITGTDPNGLQVSLVVRTSSGDDLELISAGDVPATATIDYAWVVRDAFEDCPEEAWLGDGFTDGAAVVDTRSSVYENQGGTPFTTMFDATVDLGAGYVWEIGDVASAALFRVTEASGTSATAMVIGADVDTYDNNAVAVTFDNGVTVDNGSNAINLGVTADQIDFTGNGTVTSSSGSTMTFGSTNANTTLRTASSGNVVVLSAGSVDIDGVGASAFTVTGANLTLETITTGTLAVNSAGILDMDGASAVTIDSVGGVSIDAGASSNFTADGTLQLRTTTAGDIQLTSVDCILGTVGTSASGHERWNSRHHYFGEVSANPNYVTLNAQNTGTSIRGGTVVVTDANTYTPGNTVSATTSTTFTVDAGAPGISTGDFLLVTGASVECVNGLYQILTATSGTLTIDTTPSEEFFKTSIGYTGSVTATLFRATVCVMRCSATGAWEVADGDTGALTYTELGTTAGSTLQAAYVAGSDILVSSANTPLNFTGTPDDSTNVLELAAGNHTAGTGGSVLTVADDASSTGTMVGLTSNGSGTGLDVLQTGSGASLVTRTSSQTLFTVNGTGGVAATPLAAQDFTATMLTTGNFDVDVVTGDVSFNASGAGGTFLVDGFESGNVSADSATSTAATLALSANNTSSGNGVLTLHASATGAGAGTIGITADDNIDISVDAVVNTVNIATGAAAKTVNVVTGTTASSVTMGTNAAHTVTVGDVTNTGAVQVNSASAVGLDVGGTVTIDMASTGTTAATDWTLTFPTKLVSATTNLDKNAATNAAIARTEASYSSFQNGTEGNLAVNFNTGYTTATGTNTFQVTVVNGSTATATTISAFTNNGAATNMTATTAGSATFSAGDMVLVTGGSQAENEGIYEVVTHVANTLTLAAANTAGAEFCHNQVTTTTGDSAAICLVTLSVLRVSATGDFQIAEAFSDVGTINYVDLGTTASLLSTAVNNQLTAGAFTQNTGTLEWGIPDGGRVEFGDASNNLLFELAGDGTSGGGITGVGGNTSDGTGGLVSFTGGVATTATESGGAVTLMGGLGLTTGLGGVATVGSGNGGVTGNGGVVSITSGDGGATSGNGGDLNITSGDGPTLGIAGTINVLGGNSTSNEDAGGSINIDAGDAADGNGGSVSITGGTGSDTRSGGPITLQSGQVASGDGASGSITLETLAGLGTGNGGSIILNGGNSGVGVTGNGSSVTVSAGDAASTNGSGGSITLTSGINTGSGSAGVVSVGTGTGAVIGQDDIVLTLDNNGSGTGGGQVMSLYTGDAAPSHTANSGSLFLFDDGSSGALYVNESTGGSGTTWSEVTTAAAAVTRKFFQTTMTMSVSAGSSITSSDITGTLPTKPTSGFTFDIDAEIYLNGILLMNGSGNEVASGSGDTIDVLAAGPGPTFRVGDVITIIYHTNSTAG